MTTFITTEKFIQLILSEYSQRGCRDEGKSDISGKSAISGKSDISGPPRILDQSMVSPLKISSLSDVNNTALLDRKNAARIVHEFMRTVYGEADEEDIAPAKKLKDLYDCHTCVNHVAQVYVKGIMNGNESLFGMREFLSTEEAKEIVLRMFRKEKRILPPREAHAIQAHKLSIEDAMSKIKNTQGLVLIDVRFKRDYDERHLDNAVNIPLNEVLKNPYQVAENKFTPLLFYCENAYLSEIAANCVGEAGYRDVGYFAYNFQ